MGRFSANQKRQEARLRGYIARFILTLPDDTDTIGIARTFLNITSLATICQAYMILQALVGGPLCVPPCHLQQTILYVW